MKRSVVQAVNDYAFQWTFPEIVADEMGIFARHGVEMDWRDATPKARTDKRRLYTGLLTKGATDVYHAGEWACIARVASHGDSWIAAKSTPGRLTLNLTFGVYVKNDSEIMSPSDLRGKRIAVEEGTGTYYTTLSDLERYLSTSAVRLTQVNEAHKRLIALQAGEVDAASLVGPWAAMARALGYRLLMKTARKNPTTMVVRKKIDRETFRLFLAATNEAIRLINTAPAKVGHLYAARVKKVLDEMPADFRAREREVVKAARVPRWHPWVRYTREEFVRTCAWMAKRGLLESSPDPARAVADYPDRVFR